MTDNEVSLWPKWFSESLPAQENKKINIALNKTLGQANKFLWDALNIYDDFLDEEGKPENLPKANRYYRHFLRIYYSLSLNRDFYILFEKILSDLDKANGEEALQKKLKIKNGIILMPKSIPCYPDLLSLSRKSLALCLGPIAILSQLGHRINRKGIGLTIRFFQLLLAAKQLSDDSRDWLEDLKRGQITPVVVLLINEAKKRNIILDLKHQPEIANILFAAEVSQTISTDITMLCNKARLEAKKIELKASSKLISKIILPLEKAVGRAAEFRKMIE